MKRPGGMTSRTKEWVSENIRAGFTDAREGIAS
jgi:hypothetical protein